MNTIDFTPSELDLIGRFRPLLEETLERWRGFLTGSDRDGVRVREVVPAALLDLRLCFKLCATDVFAEDGVPGMKTLQELATIGLVTVFLRVSRDVEKQEPQGVPADAEIPA